MLYLFTYHCVKNVRMQSYSGPHFPAFGLNTLYLSIFSPNARISPYSVRTWRNADQNNSEYGQFLPECMCDDSQFASRIILDANCESSSSMDSSKVISCLKRFLSKSGCVDLIISDNVSAFKQNEVSNFLRLNDKNWKFNLSLSPW